MNEPRETAILPDASAEVVGYVDVLAISQMLSAYSQQLQSQDKLGNFEIQTLMSNYNQAQTFTSNILKKQSDTSAAIIQNLK